MSGVRSDFGFLVSVGLVREGAIIVSVLGSEIRPGGGK